MSHNEENLTLVSLKNLAEQFSDAFKQAASFRLPKNYRQCKNIVVAGMGGSNLAGRIIASVFAEDLKIPLLINADYELDGFINKDTLFIASSYSGSTEETLHAYAEAKQAKAKIIVLSKADSNNRLTALAAKDKYPYLAFTAAANPSHQPRLGLGYSLAFTLAILKQAGVLKTSSQKILSAAAKMKHISDKLAPEKSNNPASKLADQIFRKNIIIITGPFLAGNAHALRNQFNENSKNLASYLTLPELNHYALEGLAHPQSNSADVACLFFESSLYSPRVSKRLDLTKKVVIKNKIKTAAIKLSGKDKLEQSLEMLCLGAWITYYLAGKNQVDPSLIPWVDWFKKELK